MLCKNCGKDNLPNAACCAYCGAQMSPQPPFNQVYEGERWEKPKTSGMAIAALVMGILGVVSCGLLLLITLPLGLIFGIVALVQINKSSGRMVGQGMAIVGIVISAVTIVVIPLGVSIIYPIIAREHGPKKASCLNNMKQIGLALNMYHTDYDSTLPSSYLAGNTTATWDPAIFTRFATELGELPGTSGAGTPDAIASWPELLAPHMKNRDIVFCPSDEATDKHLSASPVSYWYKAAADKAWIVLGLKKEGDFEFPADQVMFYENNGAHWGQAAQKWGPGVVLNMVFLDGHVASKTISGGPGYGTIAPTNTTGNANLGTKGEPAWYNKYTDYSPNPNSAFDPKGSYDDMP